MLICQCNAMRRRELMCGGGAAMFGAIVAALMGSSKPVRAEAISGSVPELDSVAVRVVVDSYQFAVAPSRKLADVDIQHFGWGVSGDKPPGRTLVSEFGLSMHAETRRGTEIRNVLIDFACDCLSGDLTPASDITAARFVPLGRLHDLDLPSFTTQVIRRAREQKKKGAFLPMIV